MQPPDNQPWELRFHRGMLHLAAPATFNPERDLKLDGWRWDPSFGLWSSYASGYAAFRGAMRGREEQFADRVARWPKVTLEAVDAVQLRPYQREAIEHWEGFGRRGLVVLPTGMGKTEIALEIMRRTKSPTLVVAPVKDLMHQWHRRIAKATGYDAGVIGDRERNVRDVSVTTYASACLHMEEFGQRFELIVFDECHHLTGSLRIDAARMSVAPFRLGLTATPRGTKQGNADSNVLIGPVCYEQKRSEARGKHIANYTTAVLSIELTDEERQRYGELGNVVREYIAARRQEDPRWEWRFIHSEGRTDPAAREAFKAWHARKAIEDRAVGKLDTLEELLQLHPNDPTLIFVGANRMALDISRRFLIPCLTSEFGKEERGELLEGFEAGRYRALVANRVLNEGVDLVSAKVAIVVGGSGSIIEQTQRFGRVLRKRGDERAVLYELVCADTGEVARSRRRRSHDDA